MSIEGSDNSAIVVTLLTEEYRQTHTLTLTGECIPVNADKNLFAVTMDLNWRSRP